MECHEIITIQLGTAANFTGAQWWNVQESTLLTGKDQAVRDDDESRINKGALFRSGVKFGGEPVFTPRLISIDVHDPVMGNRDLTGKTVKSGHPSTETREAPMSWEGTCEIHEQCALTTHTNPFLTDLDNEEMGRTKTASSFYELDSVVRSWTDILKVPYHQRSVTLIPSFNNVESHVSRFDDGLALLGSTNFRDSLEDKIRKFAEETNSLQGFHVAYDWHSIFSGVSFWIKEHLSDEYCGRCTLCLPIIPETLNLENPVDKQNFVWNIAQDLAQSNWNCSMCLPLSLVSDLWNLEKKFTRFPYLAYKPELTYHSSAILAAALETATTPWRLEKDSEHLKNVLQFLREPGSWMTELHSCLPFGIQEQSLARFVARLSERNVPTPVHPMSPNSTETATTFKGHVSNRFCLRGMKCLQFNNDMPDTHEFLRLGTPAEVLVEYLKKQRSHFSVYVGDEPVHTEPPFPNIFLPSVNNFGCISGRNRPCGTGVISVPLLTELRSSAADNQFITSLEAQLSKLTHVTLRTEKDFFTDIIETIAAIIPTS